MHYGNTCRVVTSLKEYPEFNSGNPKLNSGRRSHSGSNSLTNYKPFLGLKNRTNSTITVEIKELIIKIFQLIPDVNGIKHYMCTKHSTNTTNLWPDLFYHHVKLKYASFLGLGLDHVWLSLFLMVSQGGGLLISLSFERLLLSNQVSIWFDIFLEEPQNVNKCFLNFSNQAAKSIHLKTSKRKAPTEYFFTT